MRPIKEHRTMQDMVLDRLRDAILNGELKPGRKLTVSDIACELRVSATPVRQALPVLEGEGFVERIPHRGYIVSDVTPSDIEEIYLMRIELEKLAVRLGVESCTAKDIDHLRDLERQLAELLERRDLEAYLRVANRFRAALCGICRRSRLISTLDDLRRRCWRFTVLYHQELGPRAVFEHVEKQGWRDNERIFQCLEKGESEFIESIIEDGHRRAMKLVMDRIGQSHWRS